MTNADKVSSNYGERLQYPHHTARHGVRRIISSNQLVTNLSNVNELKTCKKESEVQEKDLLASLVKKKIEKKR